MKVNDIFSYAFGAITGSIFKVTFLFTSTLVLFILDIIPEAFLVFMGVIQLVTAISASLIIWPVNETRKKLKK